jgi:hypothetical protein
MNKNQYVEYYNDLGKFKGLHLDGLFCKNESEGANGNLPFFVWFNPIRIYSEKMKKYLFNGLKY